MTALVVTGTVCHMLADEPPPGTDGEAYVSPIEFARRLTELGHPVTRRTVTRWIKLGQVPGVVTTPGGHFRIPAGSVEKVMRPFVAPEPEPALAS